jgi:hypothetical protein
VIHEYEVPEGATCLYCLDSLVTWGRDREREAGHRETRPGYIRLKNNTLITFV